MKTFKRIMVGLDGEHSDLVILKHIENIKSAFDVQKVYFVHIKQSLEMPGHEELLYSNQLAPMDESIEKLIKTDIIESFTNINSMDYEIIVKEGDPKSTILQLIEDKYIDLLVLGRKPHPGITYFSRTLANESPCSVIFVPKANHSEYKKILVPMDFTSNSKDALEKAINYKQEGHGQTEIIPVHFYNVSAGYTKIGKSFQNYSNTIKSNITKKFEGVKRRSKAGNIRVIHDKKDNIAQKIYDFSLRVGADLILIGSKGRTKMASMVNKSVAAKLLELSFHSPILIDKRKNKNLDAFSAMMMS